MVTDGGREGWGEAWTLPLDPSSLQTLKTLRQVEVINFGDCLVRSKGAVAIADAVRGGLPKLKVSPGPSAVFFPASGLPPCWWGWRLVGKLVGPGPYPSSSPGHCSFVHVSSPLCKARGRGDVHHYVGCVLSI